MSKLPHYDITVLGWEKNNPKKKKGYTHFLISANFFYDPKISRLTSVQMLTYVRLLTLCAQTTTSELRVSTETIATPIRVPMQTIARSLIELEENQLITHTPLYNKIRKEEIRKEEKRKEVAEHRHEVAVLETQGTKKVKTERNRELWETYLNAYRKRYSVDPLRNAMVNKQISNLGDRLGLDEGKKVIEFYLNHNNTFYLKQTHSIGCCLKDCETLRTQMLKDFPITDYAIKEVEKKLASEQRIKELEEYYSDK
jgi:hypothetical protein